MPEPPKQCVHHWVIEPAQGHTSNGRCKICGETKAFDNSIGGSGSWTHTHPRSLRVQHTTPKASDTEDDE